MTQYRVILFGSDGHEISSGYLFSASDGQACASAERLMQSDAKATSVEVRDGERLVCSYERA